MDDLLVEHVLRTVECVPAGSLTTYGDIAAVVGTGARQVGAVMAQWGSGVAWWRVVNARGTLPAHLLGRARAHWVDEGVAGSPGQAANAGTGAGGDDTSSTDRADLTRHRMDLADLRRAHRAACAELPDLRGGSPSSMS